MENIFQYNRYQFDKIMKQYFLKNRTSKRFRVVAHYPKNSMYPVNIEIFPTNICNLRCDFCSYKEEDKCFIPEKILEQLVEEIIHSPIKSVTFSGGGEPLLYKNIHKIIDKLSTTKDVGIITNGTILTNNILKVLPKCKWIRISINQPTTEMYKQLTMNPAGTFEKIQENIRKIVNAVRNSQTIVSIAIIVTNDLEQNLDFYYKAIDLCSDLKVHQIFFHKLINGISNEDAQITLSLESKNKIAEYANNRNVISNISKITKQENSAYKYKLAGDICNMYDTVWKIFVTADGNVSPCLARLYSKDQNCLGNIQKISLYKILEDHCNNECSKEFFCEYCKFWNIREILDLLKNGTTIIDYPRDPHVNFI